MFQKVARDVAITSIFEGTQLVQLSLIAAQLAQLARAGRPQDAPVDVDRLCDLSSPAPAWDPPGTRLRIGDPGRDELVDRWFRADCPPSPPSSGAQGALSFLQDQPADPVDPRRYCTLHAAACCLQVWSTNRDRLAPEAAGGEWLALCLQRLAFGGDPPASGELAEPVLAWMRRQLHDGQLFSLVPLELAR
jgi:hypothetical protein